MYSGLVHELPPPHATSLVPVMAFSVPRGQQPAKIACIGFPELRPPAMQYWRLKMLRAGLGGLVEFRWQKGRSAPGRRARQVLEAKNAPARELCYCRHTPLKVWQYHPDRQSCGRLKAFPACRHTQSCLTKPSEQVGKCAWLREVEGVLA